MEKTIPKGRVVVDEHCRVDMSRLDELQLSAGLYAVFLALGVGLSTPWATFLAAVDYFTRLYPERDAVRWISVVFYPAMLLFLILNASMPSTGKLAKTKLILGFVIFVFGSACVPILDLVFVADNRGTKLSFILLLICYTFIGSANGLVEGLILGITLSLPQTYYQAVSAGIGGAGVVLVLLRICTKAAFSDSANGLRLSAAVFFGFSAVFCTMCTLLLKFVFPIMEPRGISRSANDSPMPSMLLTNQAHCASTSAQVMDTIRRLGASLIIVILTYIVTLTVYPGVASDVEDDDLGDWYRILMILVFSVGDFVSRWVPNRYLCFNPRCSLLLTAARVLFLPVFYIAVKQNAGRLSFIGLMFFFGVSNGYVTLCGLAIGHQRLLPTDDPALAGNLLIISIIAGVTIGSFCAIVWASIVA